MKPPLPAPGVHLGVPENVYRAWDAPSQSILKAGETALDMRYAMDHHSEPTRQQMLGTALHWAFFEPGIFASRCIDAPTVNKRKPSERDELAKFYADNPDKLIFEGDERAQVETWANALREHPAASYLLDLPGESEVAILWRDKETGEYVKGKIDRLPTEGPIIDLKTCAGVTDRQLDRAVEQFGYHFQAAVYADGVETVGRGAREFVHIWLHKEPPYHVRVRRLERDWILVGQSLYRKALATYAKARKSGQWSGYSDLIEPHYAPSWIIRQSSVTEVELSL